MAVSGSHGSRAFRRLFSWEERNVCGPRGVVLVKKGG